MKPLYQQLHELLEAGKLWPQCLTEEELQQAFREARESVTPQPITLRMLRAEIERRVRG
jgi:hypothetical protein